MINDGAIFCKTNNADNGGSVIYNKSVEDTINECKELIKFQKVVKLTRDYPHALYGEEKQSGKVFRVFASNSESAQGLFKVKKDDSIAKFGNTPEKCFVPHFLSHFQIIRIVFSLGRSVILSHVFSRYTFI